MKLGERSSVQRDGVVQGGQLDILERRLVRWLDQTTNLLPSSTNLKQEGSTENEQQEENHKNRNITEAGGWFGARDMLSELEDEKEAPMMNFSL